ncbi:MAG: type II secretion system minor pseudopilin GspK [Paracoccaceae bacterium]|nr:type II secretion system minor pseudopilin GspK [Paracoccaceae bacterium]
MSAPRPRRDRGFVLVNALVLVAALAGIAALLLARAEGARQRATETQTAAQVTLYLDAVEALAISLLTAPNPGQGADHLGQAWAQADINVPLDRGRVAGDLTDLQGRFNINWLADPSDIWARAGFEALLQRLGLSPVLADAVAGFVSPDGPGNAPAYARQRPPIAPVGGPVLMPSQLLALPDLSRRDMDRLAPFIATLPGDSTLNVNTAPQEVLQSLLPGLSAAQSGRLMQARAQEPFGSVQGFIETLADFGGAGLVPEEVETRLGISSIWFAARIEAQLGDHLRHRRTVFERRPLPAGVRVAYRLRQSP